MSDEGPTQSDIDEFGDPSENDTGATVTNNSTVVGALPDLVYTGETPDLGLEE